MKGEFELCTSGCIRWSRTEELSSEVQLREAQKIGSTFQLFVLVFENLTGRLFRLQLNKVGRYSEITL